MEGTSEGLDETAQFKSYYKTPEVYLEDATIYMYGSSINETRVESRKIAGDRYNRRQLQPLVERRRTFIEAPSRASSSFDLSSEHLNHVTTHVM